MGVSLCACAAKGDVASCKYSQAQKRKKRDCSKAIAPQKGQILKECGLVPHELQCRKHVEAADENLWRKRFENAKVSGVNLGEIDEMVLRIGVLLTKNFDWCAP